MIRADYKSKLTISTRNPQAFLETNLEAVFALAGRRISLQIFTRKNEIELFPGIVGLAHSSVETSDLEVCNAKEALEFCHERNGSKREQKNIRV